MELSAGAPSATEQIAHQRHAQKERLFKAIK